MTDIKFAMLALHARAKLGASSVDVAPGLIATNDLPIQLPSDWRDLVGRLDAERLEKSTLFLVATSPSNRADRSNEEDVWLQYRLDWVWRCLALTSVGLSCRDGRLLAGGITRGTTILRSAAPVDSLIEAPGTPTHFVITPEQLRQADELSRTLRDIDRRRGLPRHWRGLRAFELGLGNRDLSLRLHQMVRAIEAVILIPSKRKDRGDLTQRDYFAKKLALLSEVPQDLDALLAMYDSRGAVEHLALPVRDVQARNPILSNAEAELPFASLVFLAEGLARHTLIRIFSDPSLQAAFETDDSIMKFWAQSDAAIRTQWGTLFPTAAYRRHFDHDGAKRTLENGRARREHWREVLAKAPSSVWGEP